MKDKEFIDKLTKVNARIFISDMMIDYTEGNVETIFDAENFVERWATKLLELQGIQNKELLELFHEKYGKLFDLIEQTLGKKKSES